MDIAIATCINLPEPDFDAAPLADALQAAGLEARFLAWDDPEADWTAASMTLLRSTWNYPLQPRRFIGWLETAASGSHLWNPLEVVRWNVHKNYLLDLERKGVPVAPTALVPQGASTTLASILDERSWKEVVVKPAISAASLRTRLVRGDDLDQGEAHLRDLAGDGDTLVQLYLPSVEDYGERALVWIDGELTHAVRKSPRFDGDDESVSQAIPISSAERQLAEQAVDAIDGELLYARIDVAPGPVGSPVVMELELIEPSLFFPQSPAALDRLVAGLRRRL